MTVDDIPNDVLGHCSITSHPSESALVLQCLRAFVLDDEQYCSQRHDDLQTLDWDWILSSCRKHRVGGFVAHLLARARLLTHLAPSVRAGLNGEMARCSSNCRARQKEFEEISSILDSRDIPVVPLKGVALAQSIYGDAQFRAMFDVDILVPDGQVQEAFDALVS
ncbi:MAG: nucleotidyltransferase family protein, partial [Gammaproteobacteria bacterium]